MVPKIKNICKEIKVQKFIKDKEVHKQETKSEVLVTRDMTKESRRSRQKFEASFG